MKGKVASLVIMLAAAACGIAGEILNIVLRTGLDPVAIALGALLLSLIGSPVAVNLVLEKVTAMMGGKTGGTP